MALLIVAAFQACIISSSSAAASQRIALVVGNSSYDNVYSLNNAVNDATAIADKLERLSFEVTLLPNADGRRFRETIKDFGEKAEHAETTLFYFAGHGFQLDGINYLVPTDAVLTSRDAALRDTLRLDRIIGALQSPSRQTLVFLDSCRNNPLPQSVRGNRSTDGLAQIETGSGTFVAFATEPGNVTLDGAENNSPFTSALLNHMETPGISISDMMIRVRNTVERSTLGRQTPWDQSSLRSQFYFSPEEEEEGSELTDDDRELLLSLEPELRAKFAKRFGLNIADLEDDSGGPSQPKLTIVPNLKITEVDEAEISDTPVAEGTVEQVAALAVDEQPATLVPATPVPAPVQAPDKPSGPAPGRLLITPVVKPKEVNPSTRPARQPVAESAPVLTPKPDPNEGRLVAALDPATRVTPDPLAGNKATSLVPPPPRPKEIVLARLSPQAPGEFTARHRSLAPAYESASVPQLNAATNLVARTPLAGSLQPVSRQSRRIVGQELGPDGRPVRETEANNTVVAALDPAELGIDPGSRTETDAIDIAPKIDLPRSIQTELARLGCYRGKIDGKWGRGSSRALLRYYATKKENPDDTDLDYNLYKKLTEEDEVICKTTKKAPSTKKKTPTVKRKTNDPKSATTKRTNTKKVTVRKKVVSGGGRKKIKKKNLGAGGFR